MSKTTEMELIESVIPMIHQLARNYISKVPYLEKMAMLDDLVQCGYIGALSAARTYKEGMSKFSTYARKCIWREMVYFMRSQFKIRTEMSMEYLLQADVDPTSFMDDNTTESEDFINKVDSFVREHSGERTIELYEMYFKQNKSIKSISEEKGIDRNTVGRVLANLCDKIRSWKPDLIEGEHKFGGYY